MTVSRQLAMAGRRRLHMPRNCANLANATRALPTGRCAHGRPLNLPLPET
jgi:hypothetical protein